MSDTTDTPSDAPPSRDSIARRAAAHAYLAYQDEYLRQSIRAVAGMKTLVTDPDAIVNDVRARLGTDAPTTPPLPTRPKDAREVIVGAHIIGTLRNDPDPDAITTRTIANACGIPPASVGRLRIWREFDARRAATRSGELSVRARALTGEMLAVMPDRSADDPGDMAAARETVAQTAMTPAQWADWHALHGGEDDFDIPT